MERGSAPTAGSAPSPAGAKADAVGRIACIAIVGANNAPLYLRTFPHRGTPDLDETQLQEVIYNSLDVIEERTGTGGAGASTARRSGELGGFVGCLAVVGPLSVFGSVGATRRKLLVAVAGGGADGRDARVRALFRRVAAAVADRAADPFAPVDGPLTGARFDAAVADAVARFA